MWDKKFYQQITPPLKSFNYALKLLGLLSFLIIFISLPPRIYNIKNYLSSAQIDHIVDQLPSFNFQSSKLNIIENKSFFIRDLDGKNIIFVDENINKQQAEEYMKEHDYLAVLSNDFFLITDFTQTQAYPASLNYRYDFLNDAQKLKKDLFYAFNDYFNKNNMAFFLIFSLITMFAGLFMKHCLFAIGASTLVYFYFRLTSNNHQGPVMIKFKPIFHIALIASTLPMLLTALAFSSYGFSFSLFKFFNMLSLFSFIITLYFTRLYIQRTISTTITPHQSANAQ